MKEEDVRRIVTEMLNQNDIDSDTRNQFAVAQIGLHQHNGIDSMLLTFKGLKDVPVTYYNNAGKIVAVNATESGLEFRNGYFMVSANTNGTTNVNVFDADGAPFDFTVTGVFLISKDTTAGNIILLQGGNTVCTIAKGTTAGAMVGATSLANTAYTAGDVCQVDSDSAGNATVFITFMV